MNDSHVTTRFSRIDSAVNSGDCGDYDLFIQAGADTFSWSVLDHIVNRFLSVEVLATADTPGFYGDFLRDVLASRTILREKYHSTRVVFETGRTTLVPIALFDPAEKESYLNFNIDPDPGYLVLFDRLDHLGIVNVFAAPRDVHDAIRAQFPGAILFHHASVLIENLWNHYKNRVKGHHIFVHGREGSFDLLVFDPRMLRYYNTFTCKAPEDLIYYLIFVMEQLELNPEDTPVTILGNIEKDSATHQLLVKYIREVGFALRNSAYGYSHIFEEIPAHHHYPLLNLGACGS
jgi:hypothetical protein